MSKLLTRNCTCEDGICIVHFGKFLGMLLSFPYNLGTAFVYLALHLNAGTMLVTGEELFHTGIRVLISEDSQSSINCNSIESQCGYCTSLQHQQVRDKGENVQIEISWNQGTRKPFVAFKAIQRTRWT